jgi:hypothetical protein
MPETKVVNLRIQQCEARIDRKTEFGNPFKMNSEAERDQVCERYKLWLWKKFKSDDGFARRLMALEGKTLGCWCAPKRCHGHEIVKLINYMKGR